MLLTHQKGGIMYWKRVRVYSGLCKNYFQDCFKVVVDDFEWATEGLLISLIGLVGLLGNVISIWKFSRQKVHRIFHNLLLCLAVFDVVTTYLYRVIFVVFASSILLCSVLLVYRFDSRNVLMSRESNQG